MGDLLIPSELKSALGEPAGGVVGYTDELGWRKDILLLGLSLLILTLEVADDL